MLNQKDFIELEFVGRTVEGEIFDSVQKSEKEGEIFDTNIPKEAEKINLDIKTRPLIICLGENMILPAIDSFLIGKELGKAYTLNLKPEEAFGQRNRELIKIMPSNVFVKKGIQPFQGQTYVFDTMLGKITAISGGRITVDFNNPLSGKSVSYKLLVKKQVSELSEKVKSLSMYYFRFELPFEIKDKKIIFTLNAGFKPLIEHFKLKFNELLGLKLEVVEKLENAEKKTDQKINVA